MLCADMCKSRAAEATTAEQTAMHRVLSGYVANAFAGRTMYGIQANMITAAMDVTATIREGMQAGKNGAGRGR